ncbi:MAG: glycosyltransferase family 4 protein [Phycisphaerales bacterium]|nr:glycosyltransferase family 4 protein [Phycisphaerales bacterium]MCB9837653.1 glycosyltransferase family 4 protein [Phycisphaera sp.]
MRALILADSCNPEWPSLPIVGYKAALALAEVCDVTVATHVRNRENIEKHGFGKAEVVYLDNEYIAKPMYKASTLIRGGKSVAWTAGIAMSYLPYIAFERQAWKHLGDRIRGKQFDVVHRITPMSPTLPSWIAGRGDVPFVLGPLNGGLKWPPEFKAELAREREWLTYVRGAYRHLPYLKRTYKKSACILAGFKHTMNDIPEWCHDRVVLLPEVGVDPSVFQSRTPTNSERLTFVFVGRLVPYKCADVAIRAFAQSEDLRKHRLLIIGDGPDRPMLEALIREHKLEDTVELAGWVDQKEVGNLLRSADVFVFPSIRELGAGVVVEAMAAGLPSVVVDYGGPGGLITDECGRKVQLGTKEQIAQAMRIHLDQLAHDKDLRENLGAAARKRVEDHLTWQAKARQTLDVYEWVTGQRREKPEFAVQ